MNYVVFFSNGNHVFFDTADCALANASKPGDTVYKLTPIKTGEQNKQRLWLHLRAKKDWRSKTNLTRYMKNRCLGVEVDMILHSLEQEELVERRVINNAKGRNRLEFRAIPQLKGK